MSIMPEGGWGDLGQQSPAGTPEINQGARIVRSPYLSCKVCERGTLSSKTMFRLSGPAVAIGFILLIPSIIGMIFSALILLGVIAVSGAGMTHVQTRSNRPAQSVLDANFRESCAKNFKVGYERAAGAPASMALTEQVCECALSAFKETGSETVAVQTCTEQAEEGTLSAPERDVSEFYADDVSNQTPGSTADKEPSAAFLGLFGFLGSISAIAMGITSFVGGLLGWLLVMRKRVLQCDLCGAVVNAS